MIDPTAARFPAVPPVSSVPAPGHRAGLESAAGLLAAAEALCGGPAWLVDWPPHGSGAVIARSQGAGPDLEAITAISAALRDVTAPGPFLHRGHADGFPAFAGATAPSSSGGLIAVVCGTIREHGPGAAVLRALDGIAAAAAALLADSAAPLAAAGGDDLLQTIIDAVPDHIWVKDPAGRYVVMNRAAAAAFGLGSPAQAIGRSARDVLPPPRLETAEVEDAEVISRGEPLRGIHRQGTVTGGERWWFANKVPLKDAAGRVVGLVGISRDVSDLEAARADLARERDRLQQILEAIPDAVFVKDREGRIILHNQSAADRLAPALGERVLGASVADYYSGERLRRARDEDHEVIESGRALLNQLHHATDGSRDRWTLVSKAPMLGPDKVVEGLVGVSRDITALHLAKRALEAERAQLQIILDSLPVSVYLKDASGRYLRINRAAAARLGVADPGDAVGKTAADLWDPETAARIAEEEALLSRGEPEVEGVDFKPRMDGRETVVLYAKRLLRDADGRPAGFIGTDRDITDIFHLQRDLALARAAREAASRKADRLTAAKGGMLAMLTHEFRTPLTAIHGYADMIRDYKLEPDAVKEYASEISLASNRLAELTEEMLELDRLQSGAEPLERAPVALRPIIEEVAALLAGASSRHEVRIDLPDSLPPVLGNAGALRRVFTNLVGNAIKYSPDGGPVIVSAEDSGDGFIDLSVSDHGLGIPEEELQRIFEPYVRLAEGKRRGINGTGLGLPIVRELVRAQRGEVWAEPGNDGGSVFRLLLPIAAPAG